METSNRQSVFKRLEVGGYLMAISGVTFSGCHVSAKDHGVLFSALLPDGVLRGCAVTYNSGTATVAAGYLVACGRVIEVESATSVAVTGTQYSQIVLTIDASTPTFTLSSVNSSSTTFPALTQQDINDGASTTYQIELGVIDIGNSTMLSTIGSVAHPIRIVDTVPTSGSPAGIYLVTE